MSEILVAIFIASLVYVATKIPAMGDALGRAVRGPPPGPSPGDAGAAGARDERPPPARSAPGGR